MRLKSLVTGLAAMFAAAPAIAQEGLQIIGVPTDKGLGFQPAATELARDLQWLDGMILWIITAISIFVVALLGSLSCATIVAPTQSQPHSHTIHQSKYCGLLARS
jgi:heme/copper-type cytochrome/quinol oxidase subunit 2